MTLVQVGLVLLVVLLLLICAVAAVSASLFFLAMGREKDAEIKFTVALMRAWGALALAFILLGVQHLIGG